MFESPKSIKLRSLVVATALSTNLLIAPAYADEEKPPPKTAKSATRLKS
jgi:hypothetical protein